MGCCGGNESTVVDARSVLDQMLGAATGGMLQARAPETDGSVRVEFIGSSWGEQTYVGRVSGRVYRAGRDPNARFHDADARDVEYLVNMELFRIVPRELLFQAAQTSDSPAVAFADAAPSAPRGRRR